MPRYELAFAAGGKIQEVQVKPATCAFLVSSAAGRSDGIFFLTWLNKGLDWTNGNKATQHYIWFFMNPTV